ncbi:hypothetical protein Zmor_017044 [Zophobas morio]|uniref:Shootin-1 n=1 Tax=Zophobas morio TaxID=2755281 RepID=A0AA38I8B5_9CUCU|nr:hypothetical protein Zmor_017044 [Zophobas morio]
MGILSVFFRPTIKEGIQVTPAVEALEKPFEDVPPDFCIIDVQEPEQEGINDNDNHLQSETLLLASSNSEHQNQTENSSTNNDDHLQSEILSLSSTSSEHQNQTENYSTNNDNHLLYEVLSLASTSSEHGNQTENTSTDVKQLAQEFQNMKKELQHLHDLKKDVEHMKEQVTQNQNSLSVEQAHSWRSETWSLGSVSRCSDCENQIEDSSSRMEQVYEEIHKLKEEIRVLKQNQGSSLGSVTTSGVAPPPPPPLPPPPPSPNITIIITKSADKTKNGKTTEDNQRPPTLEELLNQKEKLRKTEPVPRHQTSNGSNDCNQHGVSLEELQKVVLKPAGRRRLKSESNATSSTSALKDNPLF